MGSLLPQRFELCVPLIPFGLEFRDDFGMFFGEVVAPDWCQLASAGFEWKDRRDSCGLTLELSLQHASLAAPSQLDLSSVSSFQPSERCCTYFLGVGTQVICGGPLATAFFRFT